MAERSMQPGMLGHRFFKENTDTPPIRVTKVNSDPLRLAAEAGARLSTPKHFYLNKFISRRWLQHIRPSKRWKKQKKFLFFCSNFRHKKQLLTVFGATFWEIEGNVLGNLEQLVESPCHEKWTRILKDKKKLYMENMYWSAARGIFGFRGLKTLKRSEYWARWFITIRFPPSRRAKFNNSAGCLKNKDPKDP